MPETLFHTCSKCGHVQTLVVIPEGEYIEMQDGKPEPAGMATAEGAVVQVSKDGKYQNCGTCNPGATQCKLASHAALNCTGWMKTGTSFSECYKCGQDRKSAQRAGAPEPAEAALPVAASESYATGPALPEEAHLRDLPW